MKDQNICFSIEFFNLVIKHQTAELTSDSCPSFDLKTCAEAEIDKKQGKGIATIQQQPQPCILIHF